MEVDNEKCMAYIKTHNRQCRNRQKPGSDLCGVHMKAKNVVKVTDLDIYQITNQTIDLVLDDDKITNSYVKNTELCSRYETIDVSKLVKIQSLARRLIIKQRVERRTKPESPINVTDFLYDVHYLEISEALYIDFFDADKKRYFFDLRSLKTHIDTSGMTNPYTRNEISPENQKLILDKVNETEKKGKKTQVEKTVFNSKEKEVEMRVLDVFQKINALDNYVDHNWFMDMNSSQLKKLYSVCEDTFNYRSQLPFNKKRDLVKNGLAFPIHPSKVHIINSLTQIREICITEFERFATEGKTKDDCKLGTMLMLTAFVEVCPKAAAAEEMNLYVQNMAAGLY